MFDMITAQAGKYVRQIKSLMMGGRFIARRQLGGSELTAPIYLPHIAGIIPFKVQFDKILFIQLPVYTLEGSRDRKSVV